MCWKDGLNKCFLVQTIIDFENAQKYFLIDFLILTIYQFIFLDCLQQLMSIYAYYVHLKMYLTDVQYIRIAIKKKQITAKIFKCRYNFMLYVIRTR